MTTRLLAPLLAGALAASTASASTPGLHPIAVAAPTAEGAPKEVAVVADLPTVKIVAITLRGGETLPSHKASVPVTIQAAYGSATLTVGDVNTPLAPGSFVVLDANTVHAVTPASTEPVTVLVHHHKAAK